MGSHDRATDGQPKAVTRQRQSISRVTSVEGLEDPLAILIWNAGPRVVDAKLEHSVHMASGDTDASIWWRVLNSFGTCAVVSQLA